MTLTEACLLGMTIFMALISGGLILLIVRVVPLVTSLQKLVEKLGATESRLDGIVADLARVGKSVEKTEARVSGIVSLVLDQVEPPIYRAASLLFGLRVAVGTLFGFGRNRQLEKGEIS